jgi:hypothetical protein
MIVNWRRSPAPRRDGSGPDAATAVKLSAAKRAPQLAQNLEPAGLLWAHSRQRTGSGAPHLLQYRLASGTSAVQRRHCMASL